MLRKSFFDVVNGEWNRHDLLKLQQAKQLIWSVLGVKCLQLEDLTTSYPRSSRITNPWRMESGWEDGRSIYS